MNLLESCKHLRSLGPDLRTPEQLEQFTPWNPLSVNREAGGKTPKNDSDFATKREGREGGRRGTYKEEGGGIYLISLICFKCSVEIRALRCSTASLTALWRLMSLLQHV